MTAAQGDGAAPDVLRLYSHFGAFNLKTEDVIAFPSGLPGFEADRRFVLLSARELRAGAVPAVDSTGRRRRSWSSIRGACCRTIAPG